RRLSRLVGGSCRLGVHSSNGAQSHHYVECILPATAPHRPALVLARMPRADSARGKQRAIQGRASLSWRRRDSKSLTFSPFVERHCQRLAERERFARSTTRSPRSVASA